MQCQTLFGPTFWQLSRSSEKKKSRGKGQKGRKGPIVRMKNGSKLAGIASRILSIGPHLLNAMMDRMSGRFLLFPVDNFRGRTSFLEGELGIEMFLLLLLLP